MFQNQEQNWPAVARYLQQHGHTLDSEFPIEALTGGSANYNYLISLNGKKAVLRRPPNGPLAPGANDVRREYKVLSSLGSAYPPAPRGLVLCEDETVLGVPFCISEFREGMCIGRHLPANLSSKESIGSELCALMIDSLAELHQVNVEQVGLTDLGSADGYLERQIGGWLKRCQRVTEAGYHPHLQNLHDWLMAHLPKQRPESLVHNDFKLDNMLIDTEAMHVLGVVDWDMCTIGDPWLEVMILLSYMGCNDPSNIYQFQCRMPCESSGWWSRSRALTYYFDLTNTRLSERDVAFYWWLAQFRNYGIFTQLFALYKHSGHQPSALTLEECEAIGSYGKTLLAYIDNNIEQGPDWYSS